jgi:imidazole glycerol phosphate synthase subunit HisF
VYRPRIIPALLLNNDHLVKSIMFSNYEYIGDPINAVKIYNDLDADELVFLDITATKELSDRESLIISLITVNKQVCAVELTRSTALSADGVRLCLKKLKNKEILHRKGSTKGGDWIVLKKKLK